MESKGVKRLARIDNIRERYSDHTIQICAEARNARERYNRAVKAYRQKPASKQPMPDAGTKNCYERLLHTKAKKVSKKIFSIFESARDDHDTHT